MGFNYGYKLNDNPKLASLREIPFGPTMLRSGFPKRIKMSLWSVMPIPRCTAFRVRKYMY